MREVGAAVSERPGSPVGSNKGQNYVPQRGGIRRSTRKRIQPDNPMNPAPKSSDVYSRAIMDRYANLPNALEGRYDMAANDAEILADQPDTSDMDTIGYRVDTDDESESSESLAEDTSIDAGPPPNTEMLAQFREYCDTHSHYFLPLSKADRTSIRLLVTLRKKKAPLNAYPELLEWHLKETKHLMQHETLKDTHEYFHRQTIMNRLLKRYNLEPMIPKLKKLLLPHSKAVVTIPYRDAADCLVSLLTDPRVKDEHLLFWNKDPLSPPPEKIVHLRDLNTGEAVLESYKKYVTKPNQSLLGIKFYIDGAVTGQFSDLPITALKMALGIHSQDCRFHPWAWRTLAWIPQVRKQKARGKKLFQESKHLDAEDMELMDREGDYADSDGNLQDSEDEATEEAVKAQDFHTMLSFALKSFVALQETGFIWDVAAYGKVFKAVEFVLFVVNVNCDSEEGDLLCGKYTVRTRNVKHICRYCHCPTSEADNPNARYPMKTQPDIKRLVDRADLEGLRQISQQNIQNAWYKVRFHAANDRGIHGACPSEMLHAILLGVFKYARDIFFIYMGEESQLAEDINGLAQMYGKLLTHQSDRDLPHTNFAKGIQKGKLMAKQYRGVLLIMAAVLRSTMGRKLLMKRKSFGKEQGLSDWTLLVELLLEWEAFLCQKEMKRSDVVRLKEKHRFIMYIMRNVAKRSKGMGLKIMKFHAILHLVEDILLYGVPSEFDTGPQESHHKDSKVAAKLTQRKEATFDHQTGIRMTEFMAIDLAMLEVQDGDVVWKYFVRHTAAFEDCLADEMEALNVSVEEESDCSGGNDSHFGSTSNGSIGEDGELVGGDTKSNEESMRIETSGTRIRIFEDSSDNDEPSFEVQGKSKHKEKTSWSVELVHWLNDLQNLVGSYHPKGELPVRTEHRRGDILFRGHPNHRGDGPWKDWALFDWGPGYGSLPGHIWCFVELDGLPFGRGGLEFGGVRIENGVFAVVETATYVDPETLPNSLQSDLFVPLMLDVKGVNAAGEVTGRQFFLADVGSILGPCIVVPDVGGPPNAYFQVKSRAMWADEFEHWLRQPHQDDVMVLSDNEEETDDPSSNKRARQS